MASAPEFASSPKIGIGSLTTSNANLNGSGTLVTVLTAGSSGTKVNEITVQSTGTATAGVVRIFVHDGSASYLFDEIQISATIPSSTATAYRYYKSYDNLILPSGYSLKACPSNSETFNVIAWGGDL